MSNKHKEFQDFGRLSPEHALAYDIISKWDEFEKLLDDPMKLAEKLILTMGEIEFVASCTELTKLSMIMGDTRKQYSSKGLRDELKRIASGTGGNPSA